MARRGRPAVTVVVPVWDRYCTFLGESVESALSQDGVDVRVVVVDNASASPLPELPSGTVVVRSPVRLSVGAARNLALQEVDTPYVSFLDADDVLLPGALAWLANRLEAEPRIVTCGGRFVAWDPGSGERKVVRRAPTPAALTVSQFPRMFALANLVYNTFPVVGCVHRTGAVLDAGGFGDGSVGEDWILGALLAWRGRIELHERQTFLRRVHHGSLWYRPHPPQALLERSALLRERAASDDAVPGWAKALLPAVARLHRRSVKKASRSGDVQPEHPLLAAEPSR